MPMPDLIALRKIATKAAQAAGVVLRQPDEALREVAFSDRRDVKLAADTEAEKAVRAILSAESDLPIYGEELGGDTGVIERGELVWVVDPLDGTFNYLRGIPLCAVSIGLMRGTDPLLGVIYDFNNDKLYAGSEVESLTCNAKPLVADWADTIDQAALCTGFPAGMDKNADSLGAFVQLLAPYKKVRMVGTAAMALTLVASGRTDVYFEPSIRLWDVAAGLALVKAAGGVVRMQPSANKKTLAYDVWAAGRVEFIVSD
jgi:myo-inositol-1(or 4)-monophosphatase